MSFNLFLVLLLEMFGMYKAKMRRKSISRVCFKPVHEVFLKRSLVKQYLLIIDEFLLVPRLRENVLCYVQLNRNALVFCTVMIVHPT